MGWVWLGRVELGRVGLGGVGEGLGPVVALTLSSFPKLQLMIDVGGPKVHGLPSGVMGDCTAGPEDACASPRLRTAPALSNSLDFNRRFA